MHRRTAPKQNLHRNCHLNRHYPLIALFAILMGVFASDVRAVQTEVFLDDTVADFAGGDLTTATLTSKGILRPPFRRELLAQPDAAIVWNIAEHGDARYIATGHEGRLFRQSGSGEPTLVHKFKESSLYAILSDEQAGLLVGASPGGKVYRIEDGKEPAVFASTGAAVVWDLVRQGDAIYAATGSKPQIVRIADDGTTATLGKMPEVLNILDLAPIPNSGDLLATTQGPGYLLRVTPEGKVTVLVDPEQEEVRRVAVLPDGSFVAAVNGVRSPGDKALERAPAAEVQKAGSKPRPESFIVRVYPDGMTREWWTSMESPIHDLFARPDGSIIVAAGLSGNLILVTPEGDADLAGVSDDDVLARLAPAAHGGVLLGTGSAAAVLSFDSAGLQKGIFESRVHDAKGTVRWGRIRARLDAADGAITIATRSGNTAKPDDTWHDWTTPTDFNSWEFVAASPAARFFQYRLELSLADSLRAATPEVDFVRVFYTRPNEAPGLTNLVVGAPKQKPPGPPGPPPIVAKIEPFPHSNPGALEATWVPQDQNNDTLLFDVHLQEAGEKEWTRLEKEITDPRLVFDTTQIPDGEYRLRVVASDLSSNTPAEALKAEATSGLFLVDNTAPALILLSSVRDSDEQVTVRFRAEDAASVVAGAAWRAGFGDFIRVFPEDSSSDQFSETFTFVVKGEDARRGGFVTVAATDEAGNTTLMKVALD